jgi:hypothetical protein
MEHISEDELLKVNAIRLADDHRKKCDGAECNIMLSVLAMLLRRAGITLTPEEYRHFV